MSDPVLELLQKNGLEYKFSGRDYLVKCLNPEHPDSNPSMRIDRVTGVFNCFSCAFKGNIFKYYGVFTNPIPLRIAKLKEKLNNLKFMSTGLEIPIGATPYNRTFRGISAQTLKHFEAFYTNQVEQLQDRIVFPIRDITNKIQVYVARHTLSNGNPRYVNYPARVQMPVFPPQVPHGNHSLVLVEGIFDLLNLYDKGLTNVACTFGTNLLPNDTKGKLMPFKAQGITHIYILYDGDEAGVKAAHQLKPLIEQCEYIVEIIALPEGSDPGDLDQEDVTSLCEYVKK